MYYAFICKDDINYTNGDRFQSNGLAVESPGALAERKRVVLQDAMSCPVHGGSRQPSSHASGRAGPLEWEQVKVAGLRPSLTLRGMPTSVRGQQQWRAGWVGSVQVQSPLPPALGMNPRSLGERSSALTTAPAAVELPRDSTSGSWEPAAAT